MKENLPVIRKKSLWDKIKAFFYKKELKEKQPQIRPETVKDSYLEREQERGKRRNYLLALQEKLAVKGR